MQWHSVIFSPQLPYRLVRHLVFWLAWWLYFSFCYYLYQHTDPKQLVTLGSCLVLKTFLLIVLDAVACYTFIYWLLPRFMAGKWLSVTAMLLVLGVFLFAAGYVMYWTIFPFVESLFGAPVPNHYPTRFWPAISLGLIEPLKVLAAAAIIKYVKYWWLQQKESEKLEQEKIEAELQLLKAQIHPNFLFTALNNIYDYSLQASPQAPTMLVKLADLLSYMLYECDHTLVPVQKELHMMKEYIALEEIRLNNAIEMQVSIYGDMTGKKIAPFLLLPFIEMGFTQINIHSEQPWMNMDISMADDTFTMKLAHGMEPGAAPSSYFHPYAFNNIKKRLHLIYPHQHELKINSEREMLMVVLKIRLSETAVPLPLASLELE